jgi:two-component system chemotaxis response regulator CheB
MLDLEMPRMDGFTFLRLLMAQQPTPVVVVSSHSRKSDVFKALELGALDFVAKPDGGAPLDDVAREIAEKCALLRSLHIDNLAAPTEMAAPVAFHTVGLAEPARVVAIGASTGGPQALLRLLGTLPAKLPAGFVVAQHMPESFTTTFAERIRRMTPFSAQEAADGDVVTAGRVLVAPGGHHLEVRRDAEGTLRAELSVHHRLVGYCPSVDRLFASVALTMGPRACAVVLTGMGQDGREGVAAVRQAGGLTLAESDETAVVYGMPHAAVESGVDEVLALPALAVRIARFATEG